MNILHRHDWESVGVQSLVVSHFNRKGERVGGDLPVTEVLQRCECQKIRTITLDGEWTLDQVNAK